MFLRSVLYLHPQAVQLFGISSLAVLCLWPGWRQRRMLKNQHLFDQVL